MAQEGGRTRKRHRGSRFVRFEERAPGIGAGFANQTGRPSFRLSPTLPGFLRRVTAPAGFRAAI